ncbi:hypothetical protein B0J13DRAFT_534151 [Dactylonectria estremocensis]|uniref:NACHT-NTPase and P-loop NTPases N-terminal domain-containing protein n=1 Tax=Dactylonectria estremocensis TaxID=1079267 RepID=A0A9P9IAA2_9HYPO|nr:hypothetical protein B0J13DRAFT_534151 [Dactylonectria estremocensis]
MAGQTKVALLSGFWPRLIRSAISMALSLPPGRPSFTREIFPTLVFVAEYQPGTSASPPQTSQTFSPDLHRAVTRISKWIPSASLRPQSQSFKPSLRTYKAIQHLRGLPNEFNEVNRNLPLAQDTLGTAGRGMGRIIKKRP